MTGFYVPDNSEAVKERKKSWLHRTHNSLAMSRNHEEDKCTAYNERFHESGGVCPQKPLCNFASVSPARPSVNPRPREAATTLSASVGQRVRTARENKVESEVKLDKRSEKMCNFAKRNIIITI